MNNPHFFKDITSTPDQEKLDEKLTATQAEVQDVFAGADITALKAELNAFLVKLQNAGLVKQLS